MATATVNYMRKFYAILCAQNNDTYYYIFKRSFFLLSEKWTGVDNIVSEESS